MSLKTNTGVTGEWLNWHQKFVAGKLQDIHTPYLARLGSECLLALLNQLVALSRNRYHIIGLSIAELCLSVLISQLPTVSQN